MGRLTDLLNKRGLVDVEMEETPQQQDFSKIPIISLEKKFIKENLIDEIKEFLQTSSAAYPSKKRLFDKLPSIGDFYIPAMMNGRVIECSDASFQKRGDHLVIRAKAYAFDGYEVKYLFFDKADNTIQKGKFDEFPRDGFGRSMGQLGFQEDILCWVKKNFAEV